MTYLRFIFRFRGITDVINHHSPIRTFWSPVFDPKNEAQRRNAIETVANEARSHGFTIKDLLEEPQIQEVRYQDEPCSPTKK